MYPKEEGRLVNISVSIEARMPILDMNTDETRYERGMDRMDVVQNSPEMPKMTSCRYIGL